MNRSFRLIIAGGKTGGHLFPGIAVAQAVQRINKSARVLFVGTDAEFEKTTLRNYGYEHKSIISRPIKGANPVVKLFSAGLITVSLVQALMIIKTFKPNFVMGVGGFSSFAVVLAAWILRIPTAIQEQNTVPGITNRMLTRFANTIFTAFKQTKIFEQLNKTQFVGNPVRAEDTAEAEDTATCSKLDPDRFTLLITGGSQGAASINSAVVKAIKNLDKKDQINIIHQTGTTDESSIKKEYRTLGIRASVNAFYSNMPTLQKKADLIIARAGAGTLSELSIAGKPAILVPFPHAADDHQTSNAQAFADQGAALLIADSDLKSGALNPVLTQLIHDKTKRQNMSKAMKALAKPDADKIIAKHILEKGKIKG